jgi:flagellar capping protein FliD
MPRMGIYDQVKSAIQDIVAPALHEMRGEIQAMHADIRRLDQKIDGVDTGLSHKIDGVDARLSARIDNMDARIGDKIDSLAAQMGHMKGELIAEIRRVDARIDGVDRELRTAIDIRERLAALEARRA